MRAKSFLAGLLCMAGSAVAQQTKVNLDPDLTFKEAKAFFQKQQYQLAYPIFKDLRYKLTSADLVNNSIVSDEIQFYYIVCALQQNENFAVDEAKDFANLHYNPSLTQKLNFYLGEYFFRQNDMREALAHYERTSITQLSNHQVSDLKFHQGYAYFTLQDFDKAAPLLESIAKTTTNPNYKDANYYYGMIAYSNAQYGDAINSFQKIENDAQYKKVVPFYVANIYYARGDKQRALEYGENALKTSSGHYDVAMKEMVGNAHFEKGDYQKALPYLKDYVDNTEKVSRETLYQLSYCYYEANQLKDAVEGLKQLSGGEDSISQHAMYILGDAYLKLGEKSNARNAFSFGATNNTNPVQRETSKFNYAKLSYELGYQDIALTELRRFLEEYPSSKYQREAAELTAGILANTNNYREALSILDQIPNPPESVKRMYPKALYGRSMELINDQDLNGAKALLEKGLRDPYNGAVLPYINFWLGEIAYRQNRDDEAILYYNDYVKSPGRADGEVNIVNAKYNLGYAYYRKESYRQALPLFEQVVKTASSGATSVEQDAYLRTADCYYMLRDFSKASNLYNNVIRASWPGSDYATYQTAMIAGINNANEKIALLQNIERRYPNSNLTTDVQLEIAKTYLSAERYREAVPHLNNVINAPTAGTVKPEAHLQLGLAHYNLNNNNEALQVFKKLVNDYPNTIEANEAVENIKAIYADQGKPEAYISFMQGIGRAVTSNEEESLLYRSAENKYIDKDFNAALTGFNNYLNRFPNGEFSLDAWFLRAEIYNQRKDWKNAAAGYAETADQGPSKYADRASSQAGRIFYFELNDYTQAEKYFHLLTTYASGGELLLEGRRGLLRSQYQQKKWQEAVSNAQELLKEKNLSVDDKVLSYMITARAAQNQHKYTEAIQSFREVVKLNKAAFGAEARYEIAAAYLALSDNKNAEKAAFETINQSGSYDFWITKAYILLGEVYLREKDYFNAKATLQSVADNSKISELKDEAVAKLKQVIEEEKSNSKIAG